MTGTWACAGNGKMLGALHGAAHDKTVSCSGRDDDLWSGTRGKRFARGANNPPFAMKPHSEGGEYDGYDYEAEEEAAAVGDGIDDGVFVELAAGGLEPETADP